MSGLIRLDILDSLEGILNATIFKLVYYIEYGLCWIISILSQLFGVFAGTARIEYNERYDYLINIFFSNRVISNIYWAMALIGIALTIGFTIWSVIRKMFDASGKVQQSLGQIITAAIRSIILILGLNLIMAAVINGTNKLMEQVDIIFKNAYYLDLPETRYFTEDEYAAMGRCLMTIGTYSLNDSSNNRYNINQCYNSIRQDLLILEENGVFRYSYYETDPKTGAVKQTWQSVLAKIANSADLTKDMKVDKYDEGLSQSIQDAMTYLRQTGRPEAKEFVVRSFKSDGDAHLDRLVFLMGTLRAAKKPSFNESPALDDPLRGPYYYTPKEKDIYNLDQVNADFNIGFQMDHIVIILAAIAIIFDLVVIILNCVARVFNLMFLYIIAPPVIAASPLDQGGKFKQWTTAFLVQALSVFGTVIAMRLLLIYLPIVVDPKLVFFKDNPLLNMLAKFVLVYGGFEAAKKSTALLTGILADSAGWQSLQAGDMSMSAAKAIGTVTGVGKRIGGMAAGAAGAVVGFAFRPVTNAIKRPFKAIGDYWNNAGSGNDKDPWKKKGGGGGGGGAPEGKNLLQNPGNGDDDNNNNNNNNNPPENQNLNQNPINRRNSLRDNNNHQDIYNRLLNGNGNGNNQPPQNQHNANNNQPQVNNNPVANNQPHVNNNVNNNQPRRRAASQVLQAPPPLNINRNQNRNNNNNN